MAIAKSPFKIAFQIALQITIQNDFTWSDMYLHKMVPQIACIILAIYI